VILYHFTNHRYLDAIRHDGLSQGTIVLDYGMMVHGIVNLSSSPDPEGLGLNLEDEPLSQKDRLEHFRITGWMPPEDHVYWNKTEVRITLHISSIDHRLIPWSKYRRKIEPSRLAAMEDGQRPDAWWVYRGVIPPERFVAIKLRSGGAYTDLPL
jgi:hypothetical protein